MSAGLALVLVLTVAGATFMFTCADDASGLAQGPVQGSRPCVLHDGHVDQGIVAVAETGGDPSAFGLPVSYGPGFMPYGDRDAQIASATTTSAVSVPDPLFGRLLI